MKRTASNNSVNSQDIKRQDIKRQDIKRQAIENPQEGSPLRTSQIQYQKYQQYKQLPYPFGVPEIPNNNTLDNVGDDDADAELARFIIGAMDKIVQHSAYTGYEQISSVENTQPQQNNDFVNITRTFYNSHSDKDDFDFDIFSKYFDVFSKKEFKKLEWKLNHPSPEIDEHAHFSVEQHNIEESGIRVFNAGNYATEQGAMIKQQYQVASINQNSQKQKAQHNLSIQQPISNSLSVARMRSYNVISLMPILDVAGIMDLATDFRPDDLAAPKDKREPVYNKNTDVLSGRGGKCNRNEFHKKYRNCIQQIGDSYKKFYTKGKKKMIFSKGLTVFLIYNYGYRFVNTQGMSDAVTFETQEAARKKIQQVIRDYNNPNK